MTTDKLSADSVSVHPYQRLISDIQTRTRYPLRIKNSIHICYLWVTNIRGYIRLPTTHLKSLQEYKKLQESTKKLDLLGELAMSCAVLDVVAWRRSIPLRSARRGVRKVAVASGWRRMELHEDDRSPVACANSEAGSGARI
jgi:hypothetical protein